MNTDDIKNSIQDQKDLAQNAENFVATHKTFFDTAKTVALTAQEKEHQMHVLSQYADAHPVSENNSSVQTPLRSPFINVSWFSFESFTQRRLAPVFVLLFLVAAGGVSGLAKNTLPGDLLYPIKINVNEKAESLFSFGAKSQAETAAVHATARLQEVETLASQGKLEPTLQKQAEENFQQSATEVATGIDTLNKSGDTVTAADIASNFESTLSSHQEVLADILGQVSTSSDFLAGLTGVVTSRLMSTAQQRSLAETRVATSTDTALVRTSAENAAKGAETKIQEAQKILTTATSTQNSSAKLSRAKDVNTEAQAKLSAGAYGQAFLLFKQARRTAQEVTLTVQSKDTIEHDDGKPLTDPVAVTAAVAATSTLQATTTDLNISTSTSETILK